MVVISKEVFCWLFSKTRLRKDGAKQSVSGPAYLQSWWFVTLVSFMCLEQQMLFWVCPVWPSLSHGQKEIKCESEIYVLIFFIVSSVGTETALCFLKCAKVQTLTMYTMTESVFEQKHISFSLIVFHCHKVPVLLHWNSKFSQDICNRCHFCLMTSSIYLRKWNYFCCWAIIMPFCVTLLCTIYTEFLVEFWCFQVVKPSWSF